MTSREDGPPAGELSGKVAVVTGAARGIGEAVAHTLARRGASVVVADRNESCAHVAEVIRANGGRAIHALADIADEGQVAAMVSTALEAFGRIDYLSANAVLNRWGALLDTDPQAWDELMNVNLRGTYLVARAVLPEMIRAGGGAVVVTSSDCAVRTCGESVAYVTAKTGQLGLMRSIAVDYGKDGIRANAVLPGVTETPGFYEWNSIGARTPESQASRAAALSPLGRIGQAADVADVVAFLCSDGARYVTGAVVMVDGGMTVTYGVD